MLDRSRIPVVAAVIERDGAYLICQRPLDKRYGGLTVDELVERGPIAAAVIRVSLAVRLAINHPDEGPDARYEVEDPEPRRHFRKTLTTVEEH